MISFIDVTAFCLQKTAHSLLFRTREWNHCDREFRENMTLENLQIELKRGKAVSDVLDLYRAESGELYYLDYDGWDLEPLDASGNAVRILCIAPNDLMQKRQLTDSEIESVSAHAFTKGEVLEISNCNVEAALYFLETLPHPLLIDRLENPMEEYPEQFGETYEELISRRHGKFSPTEFIRAMMCTLDTFGYILQETCGVRSTLTVSRAVFQSSMKVQCIVAGRLLERDPLVPYRNYYTTEGADFCESVAGALREIAEQIIDVINQAENKRLQTEDFPLCEYVHLLDSRDRNMSEPEMLYEQYADAVKAAADVITAYLQLFYAKYTLTAQSALRPIRRFKEDEQVLELHVAGREIQVDTMKYFTGDVTRTETVLMIVDEFRSKLIPIMEAKGIDGTIVQQLLQEAVRQVLGDQA